MCGFGASIAHDKALIRGSVLLSTAFSGDQADIALSGILEEKELHPLSGTAAKMIPPPKVLTNRLRAGL